MRAIIFGLLLLPVPLLASTWPFINEIHYDNAGPDTGEGVELAGLAGTTLDGWSLLFYNGSSGSIYRTVDLDGTFADQDNGHGALFFLTGALQNGAPDGVALIGPDKQVRQFISYEGSFTATEGAAEGWSSLDIGLAESSDTPEGWSLQLTGPGPGQFTWTAAAASYGAINAGQAFAAVPLPGGLTLLAGAVAGLLGWRNR